MSSEVTLFMFLLFDTGALFFLSIYTLITLSDYECDYINAKECNSNLNKWIIPEYIAFSTLLFLLLITGHWWFLLFNLPLFIYMYYIHKVTHDGLSIFYASNTVTNFEIVNRILNCSTIKLIHHLIFIIIYLYFALLNFFISE